jgi:hypothetical protein
MGIRGAFTTLRKAFTTIEPIELEPLKIGIDMFSLVYTHRACLDELLELILSWSTKGHNLVCIWDGTAPKEKQEIIGQRRSARDSAMDKKQDLELYLEKFGSQLNDSDIKHLKTAITSLSWQGWHLSGTLKRTIQEKLAVATHIYSPGEADDLLITMISKGELDVVVSLDSDILAMGAQRLWRILRFQKNWILEDISVERVCNTFGISLATLQDTCFLAGWDRCHLSGTSYMPFDVALERMKFYEILGIVIEKFIPGAIIDKESYDRLRVIKKESKERWMQILKSRNSQNKIETV